MAKRQRQVGRGKEAPLAVVGSSEVEQEQQAKVFTPEDAEYQRYSELLKGYFEKLARWQDMLMTYGYQEHMPWRGFSVFRTSHGVSISPETTFNPDVSNRLPIEPPNKVLQIGSEYSNLGEHYDPDLTGEHIDFNIERAPAGEQFFVDPEGKPVGDVLITVKDNGSLARLQISTNFLERKYPSDGVEYQLNRQAQTLKIDNRHMPEIYQTYLINTIDNLIPRAPTATSQSERRATPERAAPRQLPAPGRRTPGR